MSSCWGAGGGVGNSPMSNESLGIYMALERFNTVYKEAHPYLSISICVCGVLLNAANVIVLTRPAMAASPINALLTIVALADAAVMLSYIPFAVWSSRDWSYCAMHWQTYAWAYFVLFNSCLTVICHAVSIWLTVAMALIRAVTVRRKGFSALWTTKNSYFLSLAMCMGTTIMYLPGLVSYEVVPRPFNMEYCRNTTFDRSGMYKGLPNNSFIYITAVSEIGYANQCLLLKSAFWINGVIFKMVPCVLLTVFIGVLLHILTEVKQRKLRLRLSSTSTTGDSSSGARRILEQTNKTDRTTLMLVVLLAVFLVAELPQGLLLVSTGLASSEFRTRVFMNLGTLTDLLSLLNSAVNFVIYCAMSQKFREVFCRTFLPASVHSRYCSDADASTMCATNGNSMALRNRSSLVPFRSSNAPEVTSATYPAFRNAKSSLTASGVRKKQSADSDASTALLGIPRSKRASR